MAHSMLNVIYLLVNVFVKKTLWGNVAICAKKINIATVLNVTVSRSKIRLILINVDDSSEDCPACYREVQKRVYRYRQDLNLLESAISTLNSSETLSSLREDRRLSNDLDGLAKNLNNLKIDLNREKKIRSVSENEVKIRSISGVGLVIRNKKDFDDEEIRFRSNLTDFEIRYRKLEREIPGFTNQNDRIGEVLGKANETYRKETTHQLGKKEKRKFSSFEICFRSKFESTKFFRTSNRSAAVRTVNINRRSTKL